VKIAMSSSFAKANSKLKKLPSKKQFDQQKKALMEYLSSEYGITYFNKAFLGKLEHIHYGTLSNISAPVTLDVVLEMFRHYKSHLLKQYVYNQSIGKVFDTQQGRLNYDLATVLARHSDYVKATQADAALIAETQSAHDKIAETLIVARPINNVPPESTSIDEMLDIW